MNPSHPMQHRYGFTWPAIATLLIAPAIYGQAAPQPRGSANVQVLSHVPLDDGPAFTRSDLDMEQELARPYVYVGRNRGPRGFDIVSVADPAHAKVIYRWRIENDELHLGNGGQDNKYFKWNGRYYLIQSFQFRQGGPDADLGAIVFDVTGLPDTSTIREIGRIREPDAVGGFHNIFAYKHSDGRVLLFTTTNGPYGNIYDMGKFVDGDIAGARLGRLPWPSTAKPSIYGSLEGYHDFYVAYDPTTGQDKAYGSGYDGYYVYDITTPERPELVTSVVGVPGVEVAHTLSASPDGRFAVGQTEYLYSPVRLYDLQPGLSGQVQTISEEIGVWTANWQGFTHNHEMRWPYVFVSAFDEGMYVFNMRDPTNPSTVGYFDTYDGPRLRGIDPRTAKPGTTGFNGAFGIDVRNADGLIVTSDFTTGLWVFRLDGFDGWNGNDWGVPNISSVQNWDHPPARVVP